MPPGRPSKVLRLPVDLVDRLAVDAEARGVSVPELVESRCYPPDLDVVARVFSPPLDENTVAVIGTSGLQLRCVCPSPRPKLAASAPICTGCRLPR
jgi:hypothetical protein